MAGTGAGLVLLGLAGDDDALQRGAGRVGRMAKKNNSEPQPAVSASTVKPAR